MPFVFDAMEHDTEVPAAFTVSRAHPLLPASPPDSPRAGPAPVFDTLLDPLCAPAKVSPPSVVDAPVPPLPTRAAGAELSQFRAIAAASAPLPAGAARAFIRLDSASFARVVGKGFSRANECARSVGGRHANVTKLPTRSDVLMVTAADDDTLAALEIALLAILEAPPVPLASFPASRTAGVDDAAARFFKKKPCKWGTRCRTQECSFDHSPTLADAAPFWTPSPASSLSSRFSAIAPNAGERISARGANPAAFRRAAADSDVVGSGLNRSDSRGTPSSRARTTSDEDPVCTNNFGGSSGAPGGGDANDAGRASSHARPPPAAPPDALDIDGGHVWTPPSTWPMRNPPAPLAAQPCSRHVLIDNSNIFIAGKNVGAGAAAENAGLRLSVQNLCSLLERGSLGAPAADAPTVGKRFVCGSRQYRAADTIWERYRAAGYTVRTLARDERGDEESIDSVQHAVGYSLISKHQDDAPGSHVLVLATGDGNSNDGETSFPSLVFDAARRGFRVEVWAWAHARSKNFERVSALFDDGRVTLHDLDAFHAHVMYTEPKFRQRDGAHAQHTSPPSASPPVPSLPPTAAAPVAPYLSLDPTLPHSVASSARGASAAPSPTKDTPPVLDGGAWLAALSGATNSWVPAPGCRQPLPPGAAPPPYALFAGGAVEPAVVAGEFDADAEVKRAAELRKRAQLKTAAARGALSS